MNHFAEMQNKFPEMEIAGPWGLNVLIQLCLLEFLALRKSAMNGSYQDGCVIDGLYSILQVE